jgi:hypothetical protein
MAYACVSHKKTHNNKVSFILKKSRYQTSISRRKIDHTPHPPPRKKKKEKKKRESNLIS